MIFEDGTAKHILASATPVLELKTFLSLSFLSFGGRLPSPAASHQFMSVLFIALFLLYPPRGG